MRLTRAPFLFAVVLMSCSTGPESQLLELHQKQARFAPVELKEVAPIWKQEHWAGGSDWAVEQHAIRPAVSSATAASER